MKHEIEIEGLPEGWEPVEFRCPNDGESYIGYDGKVVTSLIANDFYGQRLIVKKKRPRRIVLEETDEENRTYRAGVFVPQFISGGIVLHGQSKIWRGINETAQSLNNADENESLRLSADECKKIYEALFKSSANIDALVLHKITAFLK